MLVPLIGQESFWPETFPLTEAEYFIGRLPSSSITSTNDSVSRQHARLVYYQDQWYVEDLGSRNGTSVDGHPVSSTILGEGQIIQTGDHWFGFTLLNPENFDSETLAQWTSTLREQATLWAAAANAPAPEAPTLPPPPPAVTIKPPAAVLTNTMSLAASPVTRSYPPRQPHKSAKVSAILHLPGSGSANVSASSPTGTPAAAPVHTPTSSSNTQAPASLQVTGPDYLWYAVIILATVGLILALVVFFVRRSRAQNDGSFFRPVAIEYLVTQQGHRTIG